MSNLLLVQDGRAVSWSMRQTPHRDESVQDTASGVLAEVGGGELESLHPPDVGDKDDDSITPRENSTSRPSLSEGLERDSSNSNNKHSQKGGERDETELAVLPKPVLRNVSFKDNSQFSGSCSIDIGLFDSPRSCFLGDISSPEEEG